MGVGDVQSCTWHRLLSTLQRLASELPQRISGVQSEHVPFHIQCYYAIVTTALRNSSRADHQRGSVLQQICDHHDRILCHPPIK